MMRIYNVDEWYNIFRSADIMIEDDGLIYRADEYYKTFRNASGKIDFSTGYIYGEDYLGWGCQPIGMFRKEQGVIKIYGADYYKTFAQPVYFIRGNRLYPADQLYATFPTEVGYVEGSIIGVSGSAGTTYVPNETAQKTPPNHGGGGTGETSSKKSDNPIVNLIFGLLGMGFWGFVLMLFIFALLVAGIVGPFYFMSGAEGPEMARVLIIGLAFGGFMAFLMAKDWESMFGKMMIFSIIGAFAVDVYQTYLAGRYTTGRLIVAILVGAFVYGLFLIVPSLLLSSVLWIVKKPFVKKKENKRT